MNQKIIPLVKKFHRKKKLLEIKVEGSYGMRIFDTYQYVSDEVFAKFFDPLDPFLVLELSFPKK